MLISFETILYAGSVLAAAFCALLALGFLVFAFVGCRGEQRNRRLRIASSGVLVTIAAVLSTVAMYYVLLGPGLLRFMRPEFHLPYQWLSMTLTAAAPLSIFAAAGLAATAIYRGRGIRDQRYLAALGCVLLFSAVNGANYLLGYKLQAHAYEHYVMIDSHDWQTHIGEPAPDVTVVMLNGSQKRLSDLRGKVVLLNFFATWCGPCNNELPHLQELWSDLKSNDSFAMLVVSRDETPETVAAFQSEGRFTFPIAVDREAAAFKKFAKQSIPRTYLLARDGKILFQTVGFGEVDVYRREFANLRRTIDRELATTPQ